MEVTERFEALIQGPEDELHLDEAALLIAAHAHRGLDIDAQLARLDALAAGVSEPTAAALVRHLFGVEGFAGNRAAYYEPENSYLDSVLDRRLGIPITLSVLTMEVGRRVGVTLVGVGMPGHFLLRTASEPATYIDAFDGGRLLDEEACARLYAEVTGGAVLDPVLLQTVGPRAIVARMLANLKGIGLQRGDRDLLLWVLRLRTALPGVGLDERRELAGLLAAAGRFAAAAAHYEVLADLSVPDVADEFRRRAARLRAKLN